MSDFAIRSDTWFKIWCPFCDTVNWLYAYDNDNYDDSKLDIEACKCYNCNSLFWLNEFIAENAKLEYNGDNELEEYANVEDGREYPN